MAESGGVIHCDDGTMRSDNGVNRFYETLAMALERSGRLPYMLGSTMVRHLEDAGFVDVHLTKVKLPFGPWPRDAKLRFASPPPSPLRGGRRSLEGGESSVELTRGEKKENRENVRVGLCDRYVFYGPPRTPPPPPLGGGGVLEGQG